DNWIVGNIASRRKLWREPLNKHSFVLLGDRVHAIAPLPRGPEKINAGLDAPQQRSRSNHRRHDGAPDSRSRFFQRFHGASKDMIDVDQLHAQTFESLIQDAIDFLGFGPRETRNFGSVRYDTG